MGEVIMGLVGGFILMAIRATAETSGWYKGQPKTHFVEWMKEFGPLYGIWVLGIAVITMLAVLFGKI